MQHCSSFSLISTVWLMLVTSTICCRPTYAQVPQEEAPNRPFATISLSNDEISDFGVCMESIAQKGKVTILVEGSPLQYTLSPEQVRATSLADAMASVPRLLLKVAAIYDYDVAHPKPDVFILNKRYTNPSDIPAVTLKECQMSLADIAKILESFDIGDLDTDKRKPMEEAIHRVVASLSSEQLNRMKDEGKGLAIVGLNPGQKQQLEKIATGQYVHQARKHIYETQTLIQTVVDKTTKIGWQNWKGEMHWGLKAPSPTWSNWFIPLDDPRHIIPVHRKLIMTIHKKDSDGQQSDKTTSPSPSIAKFIPMKPLPTTATFTLQTLAVSLTSDGRNIPKDGFTTTFQAEDYLGRKPLLTFGLKFAAPASVWGAVASLYGLRVVEEQGDGSPHRTLKITRPIIAAVTDVSRIPDSIAKALPKPFANAMHILLLNKERDIEKEAERRFSIKKDKTDEELIADFQAFQDARKIFFATKPDTLAIQETALKILLPRDKPQDGTSPTKSRERVATDLTADEEAAISVYLMVVHWKDISARFEAEIPPYIVRFNEVVLIGGPYNTPQGKRLAFTMAIPNAEGRPSGWFGYSNLSWNP